MRMLREEECPAEEIGYLDRDEKEGKVVSVYYNTQ